MRRLVVLFALPLLVTACGSESAAPATPAPEVAQGADLPIPADAPLALAPVPATFDDGRDPLYVQNVDVTDAARRENIRSLSFHRDGMPIALVLDGIMESEQLVPVLDEEGKPVLSEDGDPQYEHRTVREYAFKGHKRLYRAGDKVDGTDWIVPQDWQPSEQSRADRPRKPNPCEGPGYMPPYGPKRK